MQNKLNKIFLFALVALCSIQLLLADEQNMGWPIDFEYSSKSLPSIEVKLSPPENPLPQVSAEIKMLESSRLKLEEGLMEKLEDEFNKVLTTSNIKIKDTIEKSLSIFNDPNVLGYVTSHSLKTLKRDNLRKGKNTFGNNLKKAEKTDEFEETDKNGPLPPPPVRDHTSFVEQKYFDNSIPSVKISLSEISEPDVAIKDKIEEIEQYRTDEEVMMFEIAISEMSSLREITILELEKQIQLQLNPFLVNNKVAHNTLEKELKELEKKEEVNKMKSETENQAMFLEKEPESTNEDTGNILNVKISQADANYPTVDELVMEMQKRRDMTEKLERQKILDLQMKLLKAQSEMIKDALHFSISKIIAQYSPIVETIKKEALKMS